MARKIRSDSVLDSMPLPQQDALIEWLMEDRLPPDKAVERLWMDFRVKTSETAVNGFWHRHCAPRLLRRSANAALAFPQEAEGLGINWTAPTRALISQKYFEIASAPYTSPKDLTAFAMIVADFARGDLEREKLRTKRSEIALRTRLKLKDQKLVERRVKLLEAKEAEARKTLGDTTLTPEEQALRIKQIFGIAA